MKEPPIFVVLELGFHHVTDGFDAVFQRLSSGIVHFFEIKAPNLSRKYISMKPISRDW